MYTLRPFKSQKVSYAGGLVLGANRRTLTFCLVTAAELVIVIHEATRGIGTIARHCIAQIWVENRGTTTNRASPAAVVLLGAPGLFVRKNKTHAAYAINLQYTDERGLAQNAMFEFDGDNGFARANEASNRFKAGVSFGNPTL